MTKFTLAPDDVDNVLTYARFVQQQLGGVMPRGKQISTLAGQLTQFFEDNPTMNWRLLCRVVEWAKNRRMWGRTAGQVLALVQYAYRDGYLPELNPAEAREADVEERIQRVLSVEDDPAWRRALLGAKGVVTRREALRQWEASHASA